MSILNPGHILAAILVLALPDAAISASLEDHFTPGKPYYFDHFDPGHKPWKPGQHLNIEEVFKNYQYYEIVFDADGKGITVYRYLRGIKEHSEKYQLLPDSTLQKD